MGSYYKKQLNDWKATLDVRANTVIDIGGAQDPIKGKTNSWEVEKYRIIDLEVPHVETVKPDIAHDMNKTWLGVLKADIVFCLGVFDYVINPNIAMDNIRKMLKPEGYAWVEFPFVYPIHNPIDDEGCRYSEGCIRRLAKQADLNVEEIIYKRPMPGNSLLLEFYSADGMRAARGIDHNVTGYIVRMSKNGS
jgi:hypothetical protein